MTELYHRSVAQLCKLWGMMQHIPTAVTWKEKDFTRRTMLTIVGRARQARYYDKHAEQQACGCFAIGNHYTSYIMNCEEHGWNAIFPDFNKE